METGLFLDDFEAEAKTHIEKIETAFLDAGNLALNPELMNGVFRAAHSLKGTAGFFSLKKIVAVAHNLESVLSRIKDGHIAIDDDIVDVVLQSVDCLKDLIDNMPDDDGVDTAQLMEALKKYSAVVEHNDKCDENSSVDIQIPFDFKDSETEQALKDAVRFGHKIFYVNMNFNRSLGKYYKHPEGMIDSIQSVGNLTGAVVSGNGEDKGGKIIKGSDADKLVKALTERDTSNLELLVSSVLDSDLFSIAIEVDKKNIRLLNKETIFRSADPAAALPPAQKKVEPDNPPAYKKETKREKNFPIRLDISVINGLLDLANEMILARNQLFSAVAEHKKSIVGLAPVLHDMNRLTSEIQEKVMFTRMQPISVIFDKFPRIIRDTAKSLGKDIAVEIAGADVTLDKYLLEALTDPITQLVKNSADHGLESPDCRAASGKPQSGVISLNAYMRDGSAIIEVTDDGAGIDTEALKRKALERGTATEERLASMPKNEIYNLMFEPGISTANQVTNLSGRGVGMDIVKTNIEKLGGSIEVESEIGMGTTVRLKMPLTLSVIRTLIVTIDSVPYAVPELNVERIVRIGGETAAKRIERINKSLVLSLNGRIIPVVTMKEIAAKAKGLEPVSVDDILEHSRCDGVIKCLVLRTDGKSFALLIDDALETEQILVKPLPVYLQNCPCYSNVTVLGSGKAVTILDAEGIRRFMGIDDIEKEAAGEFSPVYQAQDREQDKGEKQVIIFKCSGSEYFAVETGDILRIEVVNPEDIQEIGRGRFVNIAGETVRVLRPEDFAPVKKRSYNDEKLYMLTLKKSAAPVGLLVRKVIDKIEDVFTLDDEQLYSDFIFGTSAFNEKILIFLNPAAIARNVENDKISKRIAQKGGVL